MGSSASKPARSAAQAVSRRYPKHPTPTTSPSTPGTRQPPPTPREPRPSEGPAPGPQYHSNEQPSTEKSSAIDLDGRDPHFAASLRSLGPVTPAPTLSHSSTFNQTQPQPHSQADGKTVFPTSSNPALLVITARQRISREAEEEAEALGKGTLGGREYLDAFTIRQVLAMRDRQGLSGEEIERMLRLKKGVVGRLGGRGVVGEAR